MTTGEHIGKIVVSHPKKEALIDMITHDVKRNTEASSPYSQDFTQDHEPEQGAYDSSEDCLPEHKFLEAFFEFGVQPSEGVEILMHFIPRSIPNLLVATHDFKKRMEESRSITLERITKAMGNRPLAGKKHSRPDIDTDYVAPRNETEKKVSEIWQHLLGVDKVGIYDNFFELGGHSILAAQIYAQLQKEFEVEFPIDSMFDEPNVVALAEMIDRIRANEITHQARAE
jgi:acyl carrier protein